MSVKLVVDLNQLKRISTGMQRIPENWQREQVMMSIFKRASQPLLDYRIASLFKAPESACLHQNF